MAQPTVLSIGGITITSAGGHAGNVLYNLETQLSAASKAGTLTVNAPPVSTVVGTTQAPATFASPTGTGTQALIIPAGDQGVYQVPAGYSPVIVPTGVTVQAADGQVIVGDLFVNGGAAEIIAGKEAGAGSGLSGRLTDSLSSSGSVTVLLNILSGNYIVNSQGNGQVVNFSNPSKFNLNLTGSGSTAQLYDAGGESAGGSDTLRGFAAGAQDNVTVAGGSDTLNVYPGEPMLLGVTSTASNTVINFTGSTTPAINQITLNIQSATSIFGNSGELLINSEGGAITYNGTANTNFNQVYDSVGGGTYTTGLHTYFDISAGAAADTVTGTAGGADTLFAYSGVDVNDSAATQTLFVGAGAAGSGADTVAAGAKADIYGGAAGGFYTIGSGSFFFGAGSGSASTPAVDHVVQTSLSASGPLSFDSTGAQTSGADLFSNANESLTLATIAGGGAPANGALLFAQGNNTTVNAQNSAGNNLIIADNQGNITGASTLIGATAGHDEFVMYLDNTAGTAHTVQVQNYQGNDTFVLAYLGVSPNATDVQTIADFNAGNTSDPNVTASSFTLEDGTTVQFVGTVAHVNYN